MTTAAFFLNESTGAGWGFASVLIQCPLATNVFNWNSNVFIHSNRLSIDIDPVLLNTKVLIFNLLGQQIKNFMLDELSTVKTLDKGIYLVKMTNSNGSFSKKIIVN